MPFLAILMVVLFAMTGYSSAAYCVCNSALSDTVLQRNIDYACANGADCSQISPSGPCFNPNTVKDHCSIAANSYYQRKGQVQGSCVFSGTADVSQTPPAGANSACFSSSSASTPPGTGTGTPPSGTGTGTPPAGTGTGMGAPPTGTGTGTPPIGTGTGMGTPPSGTGTGTGMGTPPSGTGTGTGMGSPPSGTGTGTTGGPGINVNSPSGLGPTGFDNSGSICLRRVTNFFTPASLLVLGFIWCRLI